MKRLLFTAAALMSCLSLTAQTSIESIAERSNARGILMNRDLMSVAEMGQFSQSSFQFGTARSMAMAGAMTSLGGDATSMMINPAGLGMYRSGDVTFTPLVTVQNSDTKGGVSNYRKDGDNTFMLSNFSVVFNAYESGTSPLVSLNIGLGYNKISNLNYSYSFMSSNNSSSIANLFSRQLTGSGVSLNELYGNDNPNWNQLSTNLWGAAIGYKSGLTFQSSGDVPTDYDNSAPNDVITPSDDPTWTSTWISDTTKVDQYTTIESSGSVGEYDIALGGNLMNKIYFGFTLGIQSVYQRLDLYYGEEYTTTESLDNELLYANYNQAIVTTGSGVNMKMGLTYRPIEQLRIGFAYHTPTWYSLNRHYQGSMASASEYSGDPDNTTYIVADTPILEDFGENKWRFNSPSRIMVGGSYTIMNRALISVDYQRDWYGSMKVRSLPSGVDMALYDSFDQTYQSVNTLRFGGEVKLSTKLSLRGGYGYSSSMLCDNTTSADLLDIPTTEHINYYSAGIGFSPAKMISFDLTYMHQNTYMSDYTLFYGVGDTESSSAASAQSGTYTSDLKYHNIALSMVIRL